jgi:quinohemoprotein ethanol dehydrogenase
MARARRRRGWYDAFMDAGIWILFVLLLVPAAFVGYVIGKDQADDEPATQASGTVQQGEAIADGNSINAAPAFSAEDLMKEPEDAWLTNGGTLMNQRYSPLDEIDTGNVADLKGVWMADLAGSGVAGKYSAEAQPIVYEGVMYVPTGADDVFAVSVETGKIIWRYQAKLDQKINSVCCGWLSRGVALGDGKVYLGQLDGTLVALDQKTGQRVWQTAVGDWQKGYTITAAPLYYDGMVITGVSGGEFSIRGRVQAYDAKTGKEVWRFYTVPGPGEQGHDTWPKDNDSWQHGGAPVWQTPAVDPELGLLYFSTGNASPDLDGSRRKGDNLFAASIVAVDAKTGKYRWHFQQVHHDIWDYDGPSPVVLFDVEIDGDEHKGIAEASKTGWLYMLDRETGKPLLPIEEKPVPQLASQATSKTQPIPSYPPFFSHDVTAEDVASIQKLADANAKNGAKPKVVKGRIFTPFGEQITVIAPGPQGGTNWQPTSYNPKTGMFYVCAMRSVSGYSSKNEELPAGKRGQTADLGSVFTTTGFGSQVGHFLAIEASTGEIKWQKRWPESCYAGSVTTGGNLVFVGRNGGELQAYNAETGEGPLWSFQTGAGANTTATVFEYDGKQHLAFLAGGNALAATPHGDNLWLFSLDGTMDQVAAAGQGGEGTGHAGQTPNEPTDEGEGDAEAGATVWNDNCAGCHGTNGTGANGGPNLVGNATALDPEKVHAQVTNGGGGMPAFKDTLTEKQISDVAAYVSQEIAKK